MLLSPGMQRTGLSCNASFADEFLERQSLPRQCCSRAHWSQRQLERGPRNINQNLSLMRAITSKIARVSIRVDSNTAEERVGLALGV